MKIVLFQPQIPQNTGNIVRTCSVTGSELILVKPLGFSVSNRWLKRAGLDYWEGVKVTQIEKEEFEELLEKAEFPFYFFSSHAKKTYETVSYNQEDMLIFGSETAGLPASFHAKWEERFIRLPMIQGSRCLNLATSVGIALYEALRQTRFCDFI